MIFSRNIIEQVILTNQKLETNRSQILKTKCIENFRKYRGRKKSLDLGSKNGKIK